MSAGPAAQTVTAGSAATYAISIQPVRGFVDPVDLNVDLPAGTLGTFSPNPATTSSTLTVTTSGATPGGLSLLIVTGTSGSTVHTSYLALTVPDFSLSASPSTQTILIGNNSTSYTVTIQPMYGFGGSVNLSVDGLPAGATGTFNPSTSSSSSVLTVIGSCNCPAGPYPLTITGAAGAFARTTAVTLWLLPPLPPPPPPPPNLCGAPANPWGYNFCSGSFITAPPSNFCAYFSCIPSFWTYTNGYVEECMDTMYSHSGGRSGSCSSHGGNLRALLAP